MHLIAWMVTIYGALRGLFSLLMLSLFSMVGSSLPSQGGEVSSISLMASGVSYVGKYVSQINLGISICFLVVGIGLLKRKLWAVYGLVLLCIIGVIKNGMVVLSSLNVAGVTSLNDPTLQLTWIIFVYPVVFSLAYLFVAGFALKSGKQWCNTSI